MSHFKQVCDYCGKVILQCKCPGPKEIRSGLCKDCKARPEMQDGWCAYHHEIEPCQEGSIVCRECWHTFLTPEILIEAQNAWGGRQVTTADEVWCCPVCSHDF